MNPNDAVRSQMLGYFYHRNAVATSRFGKRGSAVKISDAKRELKAQYGLSQQNVISNLTYLLDRGWVNKFEVQKTITVKGGTVPSPVTWYQISAGGIDKIEGGSEFEPKERYQGINVNATGSNVITLGDGNVVDARFSQLREHLDGLKSEITHSASLSEKQKLDVAVDIESIKDQLAKQTPDRATLSHLWSGIQNVATLAGLADSVQRIWPLIRHVLGG